MKIINKKKFIDPNDSAADLYDQAYSIFKSDEVTSEEIKLIKTICPQKSSSIFDVGCGTGRHLIPLRNLGYKVFGIDRSKKMLEQIKKKEKKHINFINGDIFKKKINQKFDLITLFWNALNEITVSKRKAILLFKKLKSLLNENGSILINIDDSRIFNAKKNLNFRYEINSNPKIIVDWKLIKYNKQYNIAISKEEITVLSNKKNIKRIAFLKQRYWSLKEIKEFASILNLKIKLHKIKLNQELYIELQK